MKQLILLILFFVFLGWFASAQTAVSLMPIPSQQFLDNNGKPLSGGLVFTYQAGTTTPLATYTDSTGNFANTNPVVLNGGGFPQNGSGQQTQIWLAQAQFYKICVDNASMVQLYCADGIPGLGLNGNTAINQATTTVAFSPTPTFTALAQNMLFKITLTGNVTGGILSMAGIAAPSIVSFAISQDGTGGRTFTFPSNLLGGLVVPSATPNATVTQSFLWSGTVGVAIGPAFYISGGIPVPTGPTAAATTNTNQLATTASLQLASNIPANALVPGSNGQCEITSGGGSTWGSCAGTAGVQVLAVDTTTPTIHANTTSFQNVRTCTYSAGTLNSIGKTVECWIVSSVIPSGAAQTFSIGFGLDGAGTINDMSQSTANSNVVSYEDHITCTTITTGATGSVRCDRLMSVMPDSGAAGPANTYLSVQTSDHILDLTATFTITERVAFSVASTSNNILPTHSVTYQMN